KIRDPSVRSDLRPLRKGVAERKSEARRGLRADGRSVESVRRGLCNAAIRARRWPVGRHGWSVLGPGLKRVYRKSRQSLARTQSEAAVENLHELQKQAKYRWNDLKILKPAAPRPLGARIGE